jgi:hypothetical protein
MSLRLDEHEQLLDEVQATWPAAVRDGAVDADRYSSVRPRLLWILREVNGGRGDQREEGWDLRKLLRFPDELVRAAPKWHSTYGAVVKVSYGLIHDLSADGAWLDAPAITFVDTLRDIAVINVSKIGGDSQVDWTSFGGRVAAFSSTVDRQVELLDPEIIIAGGTAFELPPWVRARGFIEAYHPMQTTLKQREYYRRIRAGLR